MDLKNRLREIDANGGDGGHWKPLSLGGEAPPYSSLEEGVVHAIKWQLQHRYMQVEAMAELLNPASHAEPR